MHCIFLKSINFKSDLIITLGNVAEKFYREKNLSWSALNHMQLKVDLLSKNYRHIEFYAYLQQLLSFNSLVVHSLPWFYKSFNVTYFCIN